MLNEKTALRGLFSLLDALPWHVPVAVWAPFVGALKFF
jgi:hypothetical protein